CVCNHRPLGSGWILIGSKIGISFWGFKRLERQEINRVHSYWYVSKFWNRNSDRDSLYRLGDKIVQEKNLLRIQIHSKVGWRLVPETCPKDSGLLRRNWFMAARKAIS